MSAELRSACPLSTNSEFLGMPRRLGDLQADNLDFATHYYTPRRPREADFCEVSFFLDRDPETGGLSLWRRHNPTIAPDPLSGGRRQELAKGVAGLKFEYYDGYDWYDSWGDVEGRGKPQTSLRERGNLYGLPDAVRLTLWMEANPAARRREPATAPNAASEPPLVFQTVARLNLAPAERARSSATTSNGQNDATPSQPNQGGNQ
jgi:hypothetical protein